MKRKCEHCGGKVSLIAPPAMAQGYVLVVKQPTITTHPTLRVILDTTRTFAPTAGRN
jgi:hypothetical protein